MGYASRMTNNTHSQCRYCHTNIGHDYAHPHVVQAVNEQIIANYVRPAYLDK